jgi:hypothetical protein
MASVRSEALPFDYGVMQLGFAAHATRRTEYRRKTYLNVFIGSHQAVGHRFILKSDKRHGDAPAPLVTRSNQVDCLEIRHVETRTTAESAAWN